MKKSFSCFVMLCIFFFLHGCVWGSPKTPDTDQPIYDGMNGLLISLNRLEEADYEVDFEAIFDQTVQKESALDFRKRSVSFLPGISLLSSGNEDENYDPEDYLPFPQSPSILYHKSLFQLPPVVNGMYEITETLNTFTTNQKSSLQYLVTLQSDNARTIANWAIDNIRIMDTWINFEGVERLLHYDAEGDVVELVQSQGTDVLNKETFSMIRLYFNDQGEEVVEYWQSGYYTLNDTGDDFGRMISYYNVVGGLDFNFYNVFLDENREFQGAYDLLGVNRDAQGRYQYYRVYEAITPFAKTMVEKELGWYELDYDFDQITGSIAPSVNPSPTIFNPSADSNVFTLQSYSAGLYDVYVYLPAFDGLEAILIEEGGLIAENPCSPAQQAAMLAHGIPLMPDWYVFNGTEGNWFEGLRTSEGTFLTTDPIWNDSVDFQRLVLSVRNEGETGYTQYWKRTGELLLQVTAENEQTALNQILAYLNHIGLTYKYGSTTDLISEFALLMSNYQETAASISMVHPMFDMPDSFANDETFRSAIEWMIGYLDIDTVIMDMLPIYDRMTLEEMQALEIDPTQVTLLDLNDLLEGTINLTGELLDTSGLILTGGRSPLYQTNQQYSLFYTLSIGGKQHHFATEAPVTYTGLPLTIQGNELFDLPDNLPVGTYLLTMFLGKRTDEGPIRLTNVISAPMHSFESFEFQRDAPLEGGYYRVRVEYLNAMCVVNVEFVNSELE